MKILTGDQIKSADLYTIANEPVESINLMERAAEVLSQWVCNNVPIETPLCFFIGKGNNGGDGLAVARMLHNVGYQCSVNVVFDKKVFSEDCRYNFERLPKAIKPRITFTTSDSFCITEDTVIIDAILGSGARGELSPEVINVIRFVNSLSCRIIAIDLPSGMLTEFGNAGREIINADTTLTIQFPKLAMLLPEAGEYVGDVVVLDIDLSNEYISKVDSPYQYIDKEMVGSVVSGRSKFGHKGTYGHALLICGSFGMAGAAVLAAGAALRSGCGLVTVHLPADERFVIHATNPSAIVSCDSDSCFSELPKSMEKFNAIGVGCGVGQSPKSVTALKELLMCKKQMVIDADALNMLASNQELLCLVSENSILTPHIGELKRLIGEWESDLQKMTLVKQLAAKLNSIIIVKGAHTMIITPSGEAFFNSSGNSGMAKAGSGDVLTGFITGLLARGYSPINASIIGVYAHGVAGDKAAEMMGIEGMNSSDIVDFIGESLAEYE